MSKNINPNRYAAFELQQSDMINWMGLYPTEYEAFVNSLKKMKLIDGELWDVLVSSESESEGECSITINMKPLDTENGKMIQFTRSDYEKMKGYSGTTIYIIDTDPELSD